MLRLLHTVSKTEVNIKTSSMNRENVSSIVSMTYLSVRLSVCTSVCLSACLSMPILSKWFICNVSWYCIAVVTTFSIIFIFQAKVDFFFLKLKLEIQSTGYYRRMMTLLHIWPARLSCMVLYQHGLETVCLTIHVW